MNQKCGRWCCLTMNKNLFIVLFRLLREVWIFAVEVKKLPHYFILLSKKLVVDVGGEFPPTPTNSLPFLTIKKKCLGQRLHLSDQRYKHKLKRCMYISDSKMDWWHSTFFFLQHIGNMIVKGKKLMRKSCSIDRIWFWSRLYHVDATYGCKSKTKFYF